MSWSLRFLGVGNSQAAPVLGSASAVIECDQQPWLLIDCGQETLTAFESEYRHLPAAIFITHLHMDHIGGLERLFFKAYFNETLRGKLKLYVPAALVPAMQARLADYSGVLAEGGANWWDAFQLIPVSNGFWHEGFHLQVFPVRHHLPNSAFGLRLPGSMVWTGDTRPIPEHLEQYVGNAELIAHDCALQGNPSHTGLADIQREYSAELQRQLCLYHYASSEDAKAMRAQGFVVAEQLQRFELSRPSSGLG
jgi:ribonuclease BN (tRNA processing enzyme)